MGRAKLQLYTLHSRQWRENRYVYPVISRRSGGLSIGVNLNPDKACNFDCVYCCVDRTVPPVWRKVEMPVLRTELEHMLDLAATGELYRLPPLDQTPAELRAIRDVAFSGDGEPTACPQFAAAGRLAVELLAARGLVQPRIITITNATLLHRPAIIRALEYLEAHRGEVWAKLDAGTEEYYRLIERTRIPLQRTLDNILLTGRRHPLVIQSLFMLVHGAGPDQREISAYVDRLRALADGGCRIRLVQVYTVARRAAESFVAPLPDAQLDEIAAQVRAAKLPVETYYGPG